MPRPPTLLLAAALAVSAACSVPPDAMPANTANAANTANTEIAASQARETHLADLPVSIELPAADDRLAAILAHGGHLRLAVEGLQVLHPGAVYQVYLDLPPDARPDPASPSYVGNLSLFTEPGQTPDIRRTWDVTGQLKALHGKGDRKGPVRVTFVRERLDQAEKSGEPPAFLRFTRVSLVAGG